MDCLFCKIIAGEVPSTRVYEDEHCYAFADIAPQAPIHIVVVPRQHVANIAQAAQVPGMMEQMGQAIAAITARQDMMQGGFRVVFNTGEYARQSVQHLHAHILGGGLLDERLG